MTQVSKHEDQDSKHKTIKGVWEKQTNKKTYREENQATYLRTKSDYEQAHTRMNENQNGITLLFEL